MKVGFKVKNSGKSGNFGVVSSVCPVNDLVDGVEQSLYQVSVLRTRSAGYNVPRQQQIEFLRCLA